MVKPPSFDSNGMKKGAWSKEEDDKLRAYVLRYGHWNWGLLPKYAGLARCGKSCRLRWVNYLKPGLKRGNFSKQEEVLIIELHAQLGNKWAAIAAKLPGRTDNEIKNFWHTRVEKHRSRKSSSVVKARCTDADAGESSNSCKAKLLENQDKPSEANNYPSKRFQHYSTLPSFDNTTNPISALPSSDAKPSDELSVSDVEGKDETWPDIFLPDTTNYDLKDCCFPQLEDLEYNNTAFHSEFHQYMSCSELSSSDSTTNYLTALDEGYRITEDMVAVSSSDHLWGMGDSLIASSSNNARNSPLQRLQDDEMVRGFYDALLHYCYTDDGIDLFG